MWILNSEFRKDGQPAVQQKQTACNKHHLYLGIKGITVKWLQTRLKELGYNIGKAGIDGSFGYDTEKAVKKFQTDRKLKVDGRVGVKTYKALTE